MCGRLKLMPGTHSHFINLSYYTVTTVVMQGLTKTDKPAGLLLYLIPFSTGTYTTFSVSCDQICLHATFFTIILHCNLLPLVQDTAKFMLIDIY